MSHSLRLLPGIDPDDLIRETKASERPVATVALFSGGNDSTVLAHRCRDHYEQLAFIDTGTAVPGVREFVEMFALWLGKPLIVLEAGERYRNMVLETIASLEREAQVRGIPACRWGERPGVPDEADPLCSDCQLRLEVSA